MSPLRLAVLPLIIGLCGCGSTGDAGGAKAGGRRPPVPVETAQAVLSDVPLRIEAVGTAAASELVTVRPQVSAVLAKVLFSEGAEVQQGAPLFSLDDRLFAAALAQAQATTAGARAQSSYAQVEDARMAEMARQGLASSQLRDQARSTLESAQSALAAAQAAEERARLDLSWCSITAPIAGRTGTVGVHAGNLATAGQTALVTIARTRPMHVGFSVPARDLERIRAAVAADAVAATALPDGAAEAESGTLDLIDNQVDPATATIRLRAAFANEGERLWPGQQCRMSLVVGIDRQVVTVPARAVQNGQRGTLVWVVADGKAEPRPVRVKRSQDGIAIIADGLTGSETVVVDGQLRLSPGAEITDARSGKEQPKAGKPGSSGAGGK